MFDWLAHLPEGLTEGDLTGMVEGTLPPEREAVAVAALKAEPRLGLLVKQMRGDRTALAGLASESAPRGLDDDVLAALDDHALRDVAAAESSIRPEHLPVSTFQIEHYRQSPGGASENRLLRVAALAAAFAIVAGSAVYLARELRTSPARPAPVTLALNTKKEEATPPKAAEPVPIPQKTVASLGLRSARSAAPPQIAAGASAKLTESTESGVGALQDAAPPPPPQAAAVEPAISPAAAVRMVREGRLALVIRPKDPRATVKRLDAMARAGTQTLGPGQVLVWRSMNLDRLPPALAQLTSQINSAARRESELARKDRSTNSPEPSPTVASDQPASLAGATAPAAASPALPAIEVPAVQSVFSVEVDPSQRDLSDLVRLLGDNGASQIVYRVAETAMSPTISFEPDAMLWWTGPQSRWVRPAVIPIVIDSHE